MPLHNILTCAGFEGAQKSSALDAVAGGCINARIGIVILFFVLAIVRKWGGEEMGVDFNFWTSLGGAILTYMIVIMITGSTGISFLFGLGIGIICGYGGGYFFGGEEY